MKNIHVLPTEKPSRLWFNYLKRRLELDEFSEPNPINIGRNIYITSDEEIKEKDWFLNKISMKPYKHIWDDYFNNIDEEKIILTTDQDLIKDGVQAIDDEFLEWFVKNPSCEEVEVKKEYITPLGDIVETCYDNERLNYKIIIPKEEVISDYDVMPNIVYGENVGERIKIKAKIISKEEPKQETLEEAVQKVANSDDFINGALFGSLWQQERMYSEEEVELIANEMVNWAIDNIGNPNPQSGKKFDEVLNKFKKK